MTAWIEDDLRKQLFAAAPADGIWIGDLAEIDSDREIIPVRFAGLDFWFLFLSPHAETGNDPELLLTMLDGELLVLPSWTQRHPSTKSQ